jgi:hypothetical protein
MFELLFYSIEKKLEEQSDIIIRCSTLDVRCSVYSMINVHLSKQPGTRFMTPGTQYLNPINI